MSEQFKKYSEENKKQAERDKEEEEKKHDDEVKDANQANSDTGNEIKDIADRPSAAYAALLQEGFTDGKVKASKGASIVSGLFSDFSGTVSQTAVDLRDDLYTLDYIMNMFSYDTFEKEGKYHLCGGGVNLSNYESNYNTQSEAWNNEAVTFSENKTLTNKMINSCTEIIYVFLTIFLYLLKCPQSLILSALRAFCFCGKPHISRSIFLYFRYQAWLKSW